MMANDRVFLVCRGCGDSRCWIKYYPAVRNPDPITPLTYCKDVDKWVELHVTGCFPQRMDLEGERCFDLVTEDVWCREHAGSRKEA